MIIHDCHAHFFSPFFFDALAKQRKDLSLPHPRTRPAKLLGWEAAPSCEQLADRWVVELDGNGVGRMVLIASIPGDEESVSVAVRRHPKRFVGFFMLDPRQEDGAKRARHALTKLRLRCICLYPAMHHFHVYEEKVQEIFQIAASRAHTAIFVHCGALSVGVRKQLGLPATLICASATL